MQLYVGDREPSLWSTGLRESEAKLPQLFELDDGQPFAMSGLPGMDASDVTASQSAEIHKRIRPMFEYLAAVQKRMDDRQSCGDGRLYLDAKAARNALQLLTKDLTPAGLRAWVRWQEGLTEMSKNEMYSGKHWTFTPDGKQFFTLGLYCDSPHHTDLLHAYARHPKRLPAGTNVEFVFRDETSKDRKIVERRSMAELIEHEKEMQEIMDDGAKQDEEARLRSAHGGDNLN